MNCLHQVNSGYIWVKPWQRKHNSKGENPSQLTGILTTVEGLPATIFNDLNNRTA